MRTMWLMLAVIMLAVPFTAGCPSKAKDTSTPGNTSTQTPPETPKGGGVPKVPIN
jgi:hypothetical protein